MCSSSLTEKRAHALSPNLDFFPLVQPRSSFVDLAEDRLLHALSLTVLGHTPCPLALPLQARPWLSVQTVLIATLAVYPLAGVNISPCVCSLVLIRHELMEAESGFLWGLSQKVRRKLARLRCSVNTQRIEAQTKNVDSANVFLHLALRSIKGYL